ncbi:MAG TPA: ARMT1-like domain-containing protein, partial [Dehalococcoidia bacterium]|nr:ARMT1-like domain-containing protein [Dehalococcoidia bacterium]
FEPGGEVKISLECYECLQRLIHQAATLATDNNLLKQKAIEEALRILDDEFSYDQISIVIATEIHQVIREITHNPDPYRVMKEKEMAIARELYLEIRLQYKDDFEGCLKLATVANAIDFFREPGIIKEDMRKSISFTINDTQRFEAKLRKASKVLYLADNAGEIYFDLPLVEKMRQFADVIYAVKPSPVQNDATLEDISHAGLESEFGRVITTGIASPGIVFALASTQFKQEFESADLIFAKGMGHYEALSELPEQGKFFYCLMAKCKPVADSLGVPMNSYVAMLR